MRISSLQDALLRAFVNQHLLPWASEADKFLINEFCDSLHDQEWSDEDIATIFSDLVGVEAAESFRKMAKKF